MHRYYPDIFIHSQNKIVEVKSEYTYELAREITHLKIQTCHMAGFKAEIWIFSSTGALLRIVTDDSLNKIVMQYLSQRHDICLYYVSCSRAQYFTRRRIPEK